MQPQRSAERRRRPPDRPQRVRHQGAAARPGLDQQHRVRRAEALPHHRRPQPQDLAEHLADLRCGSEIGERIARGVIRRIGSRHKRVQAFHQRTWTRAIAFGHLR